MLDEILYLNPSRQKTNIGVNGYGTEADNMMVIAKSVYNKLDALKLLTKIILTEGLTLSEAIAESNAVGATLHLDMHSDADGDNNSSTGFGCTGIYKSDKGKKLASYIYKHVSALTPTADRGLSYRTDLGCLNQTKAVAALIECFFHDNASDVAFYEAHVDAFAQAIVDGILEYLGIVKVVVAAAPVQSAQAAFRYCVVMVDKLNVRSGIGTSFPIVTQLVRGDVTEIYETRNGWYRVACEKGEGWVSGAYVAATADYIYEKVTASTLNVRDGGSDKCRVIGQLKKDQWVKVGHKWNGWAKIDFGSTGGYVSGLYIK